MSVSDHARQLLTLGDENTDIHGLRLGVGDGEGKGVGVIEGAREGGLVGAVDM